MRKAALALFFAAIFLPAQSDHKVTKADIDRWMTELSNWGRWGKDDQLGTLNLITPAKRREAAALVKEGYTVSYHGMGQTHLDAFCHASYQGKLFNGFPVDQITAEGCMKDSVIAVKT